MPAALKRGFKRTFSSVPFYLILELPCITVIIKPLYIKVTVHFHFIVQLSVYSCREQLRTAQLSGQGLSSKLMERESLGEHHSALHHKRCCWLPWGLFGIHSAEALPPAEPNHSCRNCCEGEAAAEHFRACSEWEAETVGPLLQRDWSLWWQDCNTVLHLRDLRGLFQP